MDQAQAVKQWAEAVLVGLTAAQALGDAFGAMAEVGAAVHPQIGPAETERLRGYAAQARERAEELRILAEPIITTLEREPKPAGWLAVADRTAESANVAATLAASLHALADALEPLAGPGMPALVTAETARRIGDNVAATARALVASAEACRLQAAG